MSRPHTHRCTRCSKPFSCEGDLQHNHDGWPEVVCNRYHLAGLDECDECKASAPEPSASDIGEDGR